MINDDFDTALENLRSIVEASRLRQSVQTIRHGERIQSLLSRANLSLQSKVGFL